MGVETVSLLIAAFVNASLAVAALLRNFRNHFHLAFAAVAGLLFAHDAVSVLESIPYASPRLHAAMVILVGLAALWLLREILPQFKGRIRKLYWVYYVGIPLFAIAFWVAGPERATTTLAFAAHASFLFPAVVWVYLLREAELQTSVTRERLRFRYLRWGAFLASVFYITDALAFLGYNVPPLGTLSRVLLLYFVFQTFIQRELLTAEEVVAKVALLSGVGFTLSVIYLMLVSWVGDQPGLFFFNTLIASFVILVLFDPIRNLTARLTRSVFLRRNALLEEELSGLSSDLMGAGDLTNVARRLKAGFGRAFGAREVALFVLTRDGGAYARVEEGKPGIEISLTDPLAEYLVIRRGRPVLIETLENERDEMDTAESQRFGEACLEGMRRLGADLIVPFVHEARLIGFAVVSLQEGTVLSNEQLKLFSPLVRQVGFFLSHAKVFSVFRDRDRLAAIGEMAAGLAHEIKNPLGAIKGAAQEKGESSEFVRIIVAETDRLSGVLTDFLDYAKPRRSEPQPSCDPFRVIEHAAELVRRDSDIPLEIQADRPGVEIDADPEILKQVLLNLMLNAVQAMQGMTDSPRLKVRLREVKPRAFPLLASEAVARVEIDVEDNGPGILPEDRARIFLPFFTTKPKGTGLGLSISQRLVESMGGEIQVRSNQPRGSVFTVRLPYGQVRENV